MYYLGIELTKFNNKILLIMTVGRKIEELCRARGVSPYKLFKAIGVTPSSAYRILKQKSINTDTLRRIAEYFDVDVSMLLSDDKEAAVFNTAIYGHKNTTQIFSGSTVVEDSDKLKKKIIELQNEITICGIEINSLRTEIANKEEVIKAKDQLIELLTKHFEGK